MEYKNDSDQGNQTLLEDPERATVSVTTDAS